MSSLAPPATRAYFVNAPIDFLLIGGFSLLLYAAYGAFPSTRTDHAMVAAGALTVALNWPHFSATSYRLYGSARNIGQYPATAVLAPLVAIGAVAGSLLSPLVIAPVFLKLFLVWSPYHYSGQTIGITSIYARRAGFPFCKVARFAFAGFAFLTFLSQSARNEVRPYGAVYSGVRMMSLGIPLWVPDVLTYAMYASGALALLLVADWCIRRRRLPPLMMLLPATTQYVWFVSAGEMVGFREFVPAFHSLQYLLVAWSMYLHEQTGRGTLRQIVARSCRWGAGNLVGGAALFWLLPHSAAWLGADPIIAAGVVGAGVQVHHFFVDGVIWKLKSPAVSSPLLMNVRDALAEPAPSPLAPAGALA
jgi:hypothetical protein